MKKLLIAIFSLSLILTGCGTQTAYDQMSNQIDKISNSDALKMVIGGTINSTNKKVDGTAYEIDYIFNKKDNLIKATIDNVQIYITDDTVYINAIGKWIQKTISVDDNGGIQEAIALKNLITDLPKGNKQLSSNPTGIADIDKVLSEKKLDDLVKTTDGKTYSITGLSSLTITISDSVQIDYSNDKIGKVHLTFSPSEVATLPEEAKNALNMDNIGA